MESIQNTQTSDLTLYSDQLFEEYSIEYEDMTSILDDLAKCNPKPFLFNFIFSSCWN